MLKLDSEYFLLSPKQNVFQKFISRYTHLLLVNSHLLVSKGIINKTDKRYSQVLHKYILGKNKKLKSASKEKEKACTQNAMIKTAKKIANSVKNDTVMKSKM